MPGCFVLYNARAGHAGIVVMLTAKQARIQSQGCTNLSLEKDTCSVIE